MMKKISGEKVENDLQTLRKKLKKKQYQKRRSQRRWRKIEARKSYGFNKKQERRNSNIQQRIHSAKERRTGKMLPVEKLIAAADV